MTPFVHRLRVRYAECDMQGHVFNAHYLTWFDIAHTELWREAVGPYREFSEAGFEFVVAEAQVRYRRAARFDDELEIAVALEPLTTSSMTSHHLVRRGGEPLVEGRVRHVCVDAAEHRKSPWPDAVRSALQRFVADDAAEAVRRG